MKGNELKRILKDLNLRPSRVADMLGVSPAYVSQVISGKKKASSVFSPLFRVYRYYVSLQKSIRALSFLSRSFHSSLCISCSGDILSLPELKNILENQVQVITELKELKNLRELESLELEEEIKLEILSLFEEPEPNEPNWRPELAFSWLKEECCCCCKLQVYSSSAFIFQYFSDVANFDIHGKLNELLCLCLSAHLNIYDLEYRYCISPEYIIFKDTRIFLDTSSVKDVLSKFTKEKKIDLSIFCSSS